MLRARAPFMTLLGALALVAAPLAGCGDGGGATAEGASDATTSSPDTAGSHASPDADGGTADDAGPDPCDGAALFTPCDDGNPCTLDDQCLDGACVGAVDTCDDGDPCTADACEPATGCVNTPEAGASCESDNECVINPVCTLTGCDGGQPLSDFPCDDGDVCTTGDSCVSGVCMGNANKCNDLNTCTTDFCDPAHGAADPATGCVHLDAEVDCDDINECTTGDSCVDGSCVGAPLPGKGCTDGDLCTTDDTCQDDGSCVGLGTFDCEDGNPCTFDTCLPDGGCQHLPAEGVPCDDGDPCTIEDACTAEAACAGPAKPCQGPDLCIVGTCVADTGECVDAPLDCDDGNTCTDDGCEPATGCWHSNNTLGCEDGSLCTTGDVCIDGACIGDATTCPGDMDTTCSANQCNPQTGACEMSDLNGDSCTDADPCTLNDVCSGGQCVGVPQSCTDGDPCTLDYCSPTTGACLHDDLETCEDLAWERSNAYRAILSLPPLDNHEAIINASDNHCGYYTSHYAEVYQATGLSPHNEAPGHDGYTGADFGTRMVAAGYVGSPLFEVMHFLNDPVQSVDDWMSSLYHRIPFVVPVAKDMGYGASQKGLVKCDTIDFGAAPGSNPAWASLIVPFPPDGMLGVPTWWPGNESPQPPLPPGAMYPSGPILTVTFGSASAASFPTVSLGATSITSPDGVLIDHVANDASSDPNLCCGVVTLYPVAPLEAFTTYTVGIAYTVNGASGTLDWSFTTGSGDSTDFIND